MITLPLTADPCRTFTTAFGEARYRVTTTWNDRAAVWTMDLDDAGTGQSLVRGMPLVLGANLLRAFCPRLGSMYAVDTTAEPGFGADAGPDDLGARVQVVWLAPGEVLP